MPISAYSKFSSYILLISLIISFEGLVSNPYDGI
jgi:hypothetical protein